jgi:predicted aconitase with swiveling domain
MTLSGPAFKARTIIEGAASGEALVLSEPLSFWGGLDSARGEIIDRHHPQVGEVVSGKVLVMPRGRGSSSSSSTLAEAFSLGTGPAAILLAEADPIVALGSLVIHELYGSSPPVVVLEPHSYGRIGTGAQVAVYAPVDGPALVHVTDIRS